MATHRPRKRSLHLVEVKLGRQCCVRAWSNQWLATRTHCSGAATPQREPHEREQDEHTGKATHRTSAEMRMSWNKSRSRREALPLPELTELPT